MLYKLYAEQGRIGQDRCGPDLQGRLKNSGEIRINKWFASGKIELFYAKLDGLFQVGKNLVEAQQSQRMVFRRARNEAMIAPQIAESARHLEPKNIQMIEIDCWMVASHGSTSAVVKRTASSL